MAKWDLEEKQKTFFIMIGIPGSGKSTYVKKLINNFSDYVIISFDEVLEQIAKEKNISYDDAFRSNKKEADMIYSEFVNSVFEKLPTCVIHDQTNIYKKSRMRVAARAKQAGYKVVYVFFNKPQTSKQANVLFNRIDKRNKLTGKFIHDTVLQDMYQDFSYPDLEVETPDEIIVIKDVWK